MNRISLIMIALVAVGLSACSGPRYASSQEYDDLYYSSTDETEVIVLEEVDTYEEDYAEEGTRVYRRQEVDSYNDAFYDEDDFYFSRRMRRFNQPNVNSWRYYDPYYSNDLYYVIGSPAWNSWNNNGWYDWNRPRFGSVWGWGGSPYVNSFASPWGFNQWNRWNSWGSFNYYNPWVNAYYGYGAGFGWGGSGFGWGGGFGSPFVGGFGGGGAYWCPPTGFVSSRNWRRAQNNQQYATRRRNSGQNVNSQTGFSRPAATSTRNSARTPVAGSSARSATSAPRSSGSEYFTPRSRTATSGRSVNSSRRNNQPGTFGTPSRRNRTATTRPSRSSRSTYTRPGSSSRPSRSSGRSVSPSRRNYSTPSRRSNSSRPSYSPRSSSPSRSVSPSRRSSGSVSGGSRSSSRSSATRSSGGRKR